LYKEYEPEVLKKLQNIELGMLVDFEQLCAKHDIDYFLCGGSLLGAVRHEAFIPWDDDIDIGMTRSHYDRFLHVAEHEYADKYSLINAEINPDFPCMFTKWYKRGTTFRDKDAVTTGYHAGIAIDIFCFDNVWDDNKRLRKQAIQAWTFSKLFILREISRPTILTGGVKGKIAMGISRIAHYMLKVLGISPEWLYHQAANAALCCRDTNTRRAAYLFDQSPYINMMKLADIYPTRFMEFEGVQVRVPNCPEAYLKVQYGNDYMTLPPVEKRHNHPPVELDFGSGDNNYDK